VRARALGRGSQFSLDDREFGIHSVFASALNLTSDDDPYPVTLVTQAHHAHPRSLVVELSGDTGFPVRGLSPGTRGEVRSGVLSFSSTGLGPFDLTSAPGFDEKMPQGRWAADTLGRVWDSVVDAQHRKQTSLNLDRLDPGAPGAAGPLARGLSLLSSSWEEGALALVGLGTGLTPQGDDVLVGWLAALATRGQAATLGPGKARTSLLSASFLDLAERGLFSLALVSWVQSWNNPAESARTLEALASVGHSSGLDAATGLLWGLLGPDRR
jgi:hypothetical protein